MGKRRKDRIVVRVTFFLLFMKTALKVMFNWK